MSKVMLVNVVNEEESRIAIVSEGLLEELSVETSQHEQIEGNIYKAKIVKIVPSLDAVFVEFGGNRNGFLPAPDIDRQYFGEGGRNVDRLRKGQQLLVQVRKGEIGQKGAALTTYVSIPGRYFVLTPYMDKRGVSRKIQDDGTRKQLRQILDDTGIPEEMGYIARTAAEGRTKQELSRDASYLLRLWKRLQAEYDSAKTPSLLYQESHIAIRTIRDYFTPSIREVWVDDKAIYEEVKSFFQAVMPWHQRRVKLFQQKAPLFSKYNVESQIASIYEKTVPLPAGGSIVIEQTEALVSVDVNSGKTTKGKDIEETALIANKEAAEEAARQLRLRDLGGLIVIDFIDMRSSKNRNEVRKVLQRVLKEDKARTDVGTISKFGLLELSRQRLKASASIGVSTPCPVCSGAGKLRSPESFVLSVLRLIRSELARRGGVEQVLVGVPTEQAILLLNRKRQKIAEIEADFKTFVGVLAEPALQPNQYYIEYRKNGDRKVETNVPEDASRAALRTPKGFPAAAVRSIRPASYVLTDEEEGREPAEVPEEPPDENDTASPPEEEEKDKESRKKRKKRGRKTKTEGKGNERQQASGESAKTEKEPAKQASQRQPAAKKEDRKAQAEDSGDRGPKDRDEDSQKKLSASAKRRLRRKRKKQREREEARNTETGAEAGRARRGSRAPAPPESPEATAAASPASPRSEAEEPEAAAPQTPEAEVAPVKKAPKRRPARTPRKKAAPKPPPAEGPAEGSESGSEEAVSPETATAETSAKNTREESKGKKAAPRARRTRKKPAAEKAEPAAKTETAAEEHAAEAAAPPAGKKTTAETPAKTKASSRPRKASATSRSKKTGGTKTTRSRRTTKKKSEESAEKTEPAAAKGSE